MSVSFVHLRLHTEFSLIDSLVRIKPLMKRLVDLKMPAVAVTDQCNFFGLVKFLKAAQGSGIKPIFGVDFMVEHDGDLEPTLITLYAMNARGYAGLRELISRAYQENQHQGEPFIKRSWLAGYTDGVLALSGGPRGEIAHYLQSGRLEQADAVLAEMMTLFPERFYLELQRTGREGEESYLHAAVALAERLNCPVVATNDVRFLDQDDFEAHEARVCINNGRALDDPRRPRRYSPEQYLKSAEQMQALFADLPEALENSVEIARRCSVEVELGTYYLPEYPIPEDFRGDPFFAQYLSYDQLEQETREVLTHRLSGKEDTPEYELELRTGVFFRKISYQGLYERLDFLFGAGTERRASKFDEYCARLKFELDIILQMGFPGYFLIVMDFIQWAKDHDIPVGPGRGSGAGSLVAYALKITDLDPIEYDLLFERFLNPERVSMPDFDVDFCMDNRDKVISYVADNYGREAVSQIVTFGTMAAKAVVRDVARVQGKPYGLADKLSKMIPFEVGMTLAKAIEQEEPLREFLADDESAAEIWEMATQLEGLTRGVGKHAGGVVIAPTRLTDFAPLYCDESGAGVVTQFDKGDVEEAGLVKFDFLGLRTLTIIDWAKVMIDRKRARLGEEPLNVMAIPLEDQETFALLQRAETTAVFQLESRGMKDLIKRLLPDCFEDIVALVALFRPGPLQSGMVDDFINRKHGRAELAYPHPDYQLDILQPVLEPTYGIILYQEQVMQIAQVMAGYTLGGADLLRRAMGKKKPEEMAKQRSVFLEGCAGQGISADLAGNIFDLVEKFAGYGFNKSHSAAYALVSYQTAWLKTHYPAQFMAATMSSELDNTDKIVIFIEECRAMKLDLKLPDVNEGDYYFTVNEQDQIVYGLGAIKGLGEGPVDSIIEARSQGGSFTDLFDFCARVDTRKVNRRALEALIRSGAMDCFGEDRAILMAALPEALQAADQASRNADIGMMDLFGEVVPSADATSDLYANARGARLWSTRERLDGERETLGLYVSGHPIDDYDEEVTTLVSRRLYDLRPDDKRAQTVAGLLVNMRTMKNKRGDTMGFLVLDDRTARIEVALFADTFSQFRDKLLKDQILIVEGIVSLDDYSGGLSVRGRSVSTLEEARVRYGRRLMLTLERQHLSDVGVAHLAEQLSPLRVAPQESGLPVLIRYHHPQAEADVALGESWRVLPSDQGLERLRQEWGMTQVRVEY